MPADYFIRECKTHGMTEFYQPNLSHVKGQCVKCCKERAMRSYYRRKTYKETQKQMIQRAW